MPKIDRQAIYERDGGLCGFCGEHVPLELLNLDHIQPRGLGGPTTAENLRVAHQLCNIVAGREVVRERRRLGLSAMTEAARMLRLPVPLHDWLRATAKRERRTMHSQVLFLLEQSIEAERGKPDRPTHALA